MPLFYMKIKIAVVQLEAIQHNSEKSKKKIKAFTARASSNGANVIIFPEDCIDGVISNKKELADSNNKNRDFFINLAKKYKIDIVTGSFIEKEKRKLWNTSYYIDSKGQVKARYRKINLWHPERRYISKGKKLEIFKTQYGKAAIVICWDLAFPDLFKEILKEKVKIVYCPSYWTFEDASRGLKWNKDADLVLTNTLCCTRAFESNAAIVYCNAAGKLKIGKWQGTLLGNSQITLPYFGPIKKLEHHREDMFIQEIDLDLLKDSEKSYKLRDDLILK